jgi:hypothetical protein
MERFVLSNKINGRYLERRSEAYNLAPLTHFHKWVWYKKFSKKKSGAKLLLGDARGSVPEHLPLNSKDEGCNQPYRAWQAKTKLFGNFQDLDFDFFL